MGNFGFGAPRTATMLGLNSKLSEVAALIALERLRDFDAIVAHRARLAAAYRTGLAPIFGFQTEIGRRLAYQFMPVLLPEALAPQRAEIIARLAEAGIGAASYFSPHLADQPYFRETCLMDDLRHTQSVSRRALSLPMSDGMTVEEVAIVCRALHAAAGA
jgi:dTDP-4-amino-4,6-dideoxygalactose transaminase